VGANKTIGGSASLRETQPKSQYVPLASVQVHSAGGRPCPTELPRGVRTPKKHPRTHGRVPRTESGRLGGLAGHRGRERFADLVQHKMKNERKRKHSSERLVLWGKKKKLWKPGDEGDTMVRSDRCQQPRNPRMEKRRRGRPVPPRNPTSDKKNRFEENSHREEKISLLGPPTLNSNVRRGLKKRGKKPGRVLKKMTGRQGKNPGVVNKTWGRRNNGSQKDVGLV